MNQNQNLEALLSQSNPPLRQRRQRTTFNEDAIQALEEKFSQNPYPDINEREAMAHEFKTTEDRIQVWFQNKRARYRKRMHKENDKSNQKDKTKTNLQENLSCELDKSPVRVTDSKNSELINVNSTPSNALMAKPNFSFSSYISPHISFDSDSAYYSQASMSNLSMDLNKSILNSFASSSSPLNMQSTNISFNLSPLNHYYYNNHTNFLNNFNSSFQKQQIQNHNNYNNNNNNTNNTRTAKSVFKPYE